MTIEKVDLVIVGAGPAGLAAAAEVARRGASVVVLDESPIPGGRLPGQSHPLPGQRPPRHGCGPVVRQPFMSRPCCGRVFCAVWGRVPGCMIGTRRK